VDYVDEGATLAREVREMCERGEFPLRKFVATSEEILRFIPVEYRTTKSNLEFEDKDIVPCSGPSPERVLGILWNIENDTFGFRISFKERPPTRRGLLSTISSIWDLFGAVAPFLLKGKRILQQRSRSDLGWDDHC
jgi:hypothetical protein